MCLVFTMRASSVAGSGLVVAGTLGGESGGDTS
jgi:hypothetical protein